MSTIRRPARFDGTQLGGVPLFCLVARHEGFTAAARAAGLTTAGVSRAVNRLEARLGVRLLARTTRSVRLTPEGQRFYEQCRDALNQLAEAEREVTGGQLRPAGTVRLSLPTSYGHFRVLPVLPEFMRRHPDITLDLQMTNRNVDLLEEGFDLAIRGRHPPYSGLVARKLEDAGLVIVASPSYLQRHGRPRHADDLDRHECIQFLLPRTGAPVPWVLRQGGGFVERATTGRLRCSDDILAPITLARSGAGLVQTYRYLVEDSLREGALEEVLADLGGASRPFSLLYPGQRHLPLRVRVLIDFLTRRFDPHRPATLS